MTQLSEKLSGYNVYRNGSIKIGTGDVELPNLEAMTETLSGSGIPGEINSPTVGFYGAMPTTINFRTLEVPMFELSTPESHALDFRGSQQTRDLSTGAIKQVPVRVSIRATPTTTTLGTFTTNAGTSSSIQMECTYLLVYVDNKKMIEIDKLNYICWINGKDYLAEIRANT